MVHGFSKFSLYASFDIMTVESLEAHPWLDLLYGCQTSSWKLHFEGILFVFKTF